jgi:hypothetical protein
MNDNRTFSESFKLALWKQAFSGLGEVNDNRTRTASLYSSRSTIEPSLRNPLKASF